jgi:hypothetical protein
VTARLQLERMLEGSPVRIDDLDDKAYVLVAAVLPRSQVVADAVTPEGLRALWLPETYSRETSGEEVRREVWKDPLPLGSWRVAETWEDLGLEDQPEPRQGWNR